MKATRHGREGFTLVEMMITVGIIGILASIAIPSYAKLKYKVRYSEAAEHLGTLFQGEAALFNAAPVMPEGLTVSGAEMAMSTPSPGLVLWRGRNFAACSPSVADLARIGKDPMIFDASQPGCKHLNFAPDGPVYFGYRAIWMASLGTSLMYTNLAMEDLDGDSSLAILIQEIHERDGELYRASRQSYGDKDTNPY